MLHKAAVLHILFACATSARRIQLSKEEVVGETLEASRAEQPRSGVAALNTIQSLRALAADLLAHKPVRTNRNLGRSVAAPQSTNPTMILGSVHVPAKKGLKLSSQRAPFADATYSSPTTFRTNPYSSAQNASRNHVAKDITSLNGLVGISEDLPVRTLAPLSPEEEQRQKQVLEDAFDKCSKITARASRSFSFATNFLSEEQKRAVWAIYTWCRRTDDIVDSPLAMASPQRLRRDLDVWQRRLHETWRGEVCDSLDLALFDTKKKYPTLTTEPFSDMIKGMIMDTDYGQDRYETWDDLYLYCYRVASTVGLMTLPVFGTAPGYTEEDAREPAIALGIALQITNILRDVGEDARRGRIYLPQEDMKRFGVTEAQIMNGVMNENYVKLMKFEIQRARDWYEKAQEGIPMLAPSSRLGVQAAGDIYGGILDKLENNGYDNFHKRAYVPKAEKLARLIGSWQTVSRMS